VECKMKNTSPAISYQQNRKDKKFELRGASDYPTKMCFDFVFHCKQGTI